MQDASSVRIGINLKKMRLQQNSVFTNVNNFLKVILMDRYKCLRCHLIFNKSDMVDGKCPECHTKDEIKIMCENDHLCTCADDVHAGVRYCELCGAPTCPCGSEDSAITSRVTGLKMKIRSYFHRDLSDVAGWNSAKRQELKDRHRVDIN